jgi:hypothetical protein
VAGVQHPPGFLCLRSRARIGQCLRSPEIDSDSEASTLQAYVAWRAGPKNKVAVLVRQARNQFLGSLISFYMRALVVVSVTIQ